MTTLLLMLAVGVIITLVHRLDRLTSERFDERRSWMFHRDDWGHQVSGRIGVEPPPGPPDLRPDEAAMSAYRRKYPTTRQSGEQ